MRYSPISLCVVRRIDESIVPVFCKCLGQYAPALAFWTLAFWNVVLRRSQLSFTPWSIIDLMPRFRGIQNLARRLVPSHVISEQRQHLGHIRPLPNREPPIAKRCVYFLKFFGAGSVGAAKDAFSSLVSLVFQALLLMRSSLGMGLVLPLLMLPPFSKNSRISASSVVSLGTCFIVEFILSDCKSR
jgi:hypothetical protein